MTHKVVTHIEGVPKEWQSGNDYDSHREILFTAIKNTPPESEFIEFGMGEGSTPMLLKYCSRRLLSVENNIEWRSKYTEGYQDIFSIFEIDGKQYPEQALMKKGVHTVYSRWQPIVGYLCSPNILYSHNKIVFVDNAPAEIRKEIIQRIKDDVSVIIVHDTEESSDYVYRLKEILSTFKYRLDYQPEGFPHTTAVSNIIDVTKWI